MTLPPAFRLIDYATEYDEELVRMWRTSFERAVGVIDPHPIEEQIDFLHRKVVPENRVQLVIEADSGRIVAFLASNEEMVNQLYVRVDHQGRGIGTHLLELAKQRSSGRLRLFTFQSNVGAQQFYERHGFVVIGRGFEADWQLDDLEYEWRRTDT